MDTLGEPELPGIASVAWSPVDDRFCFTAGPEEEDDLYVYALADGTPRRVSAGPVLGPKWSPDGHYLACLRGGSAPPEASWRLRRTRGSVLVLDARHDCRMALLAEGLCGDLAFSPDSGKVAFIELREDEFGDLSTHVLRTADLPTGRVREMLSSRRRIEWIWAGSDALAVVTYDRLAVPTLSLCSLDGTSKTLTTTRDYHRLTPLEYEVSPGRVIYRATVGFSGDARTELWEVRPGQPAKPLAADDPARKRHGGKDH